MEIDKFLQESSLGLPGIGQLGFIVHDIQASLPIISSYFNLRSWYQPQYTEKKFKIDDQPIELDFDLVVAYSGNLQIELIEEKSQRARIYQDHLENYGEGLHHLGFFVSDMDSKLKIAKQIGLTILLESEFQTAGGGYVRFAYLDTRKICGVIIELANIKLYGINVPQTELMMTVGRFTGDVLKTNI
jgi:hypothetical protein